MDKKISVKQNIIIASTLFGMLFGSGNLIFPVHLGQLAGSNILAASTGFLLMAVLTPILGILSIGVSESKGFFSLSENVSRKFAFFITTVLYLTIGPCFVMPRSASISFGSGLSSILGGVIDPNISFFIFSFLFFSLVTFFSLRPSRITTWIGKIINPIFLVFLFALILVCVFIPMGELSDVDPIDPYNGVPFFSGFVEGYETMDALATLAYGIIVINIIKGMGVKSTSGITKSLITPSVITAILMVIIYLSTIYMGAQSRTVFQISSNGSIALNQISNYYFGIWGDLILFITITLASIKTSIALTTSCAATFNFMYPKSLSYKKWALIFLFVSFAISNVGLDAIIEFSVPILNFLTPVAITLIFLAFATRRYKQSSIIYKWTVSFCCVIAFFDFWKTLPYFILRALNINDLITSISAMIPFDTIGFGWVIPTAIGFIIGLCVHLHREKQLECSHETVEEN